MKRYPAILFSALLLAGCGSSTAEQEPADGGLTGADGGDGAQSDTSSGLDGDASSDTPSEKADAAEPGVEYFLSPEGDDNNAGAIDQPFRSFERGLQALADAKKQGLKGDRTLWVRGGSYYLAQSLSLTDETCGGNGQKVSIRGWPGDPMPIVSGGKPIAKNAWQPVKPNPPTVVATVGDAVFRQLYAGNHRLTRARHPNALDPSTAPIVKQWTENQYYQFTVATSELGPIAQGESGFEVVMPMGWAVSRMRIIASATSGATTFLSPDPYEGSIEQTKAKGMGPFHIGTQGLYYENHLSLLDAPGEWWLDRASKLVYLIANNPLQLQEVVVPSLERLVSIAGCSDLTIERLQFSHSNWSWPSDWGYIGVGGGTHYVWEQTSKLGFAGLPSAVEIDSSERVTLRKNRFAGLGAAAMTVTGGTAVKLIGNLFDDVAAGGLLLSGGTDHAVEDNLFVRVGWEYGSDAIATSSVFNTHLSHNYFQDIAGRATYLVDKFFGDAPRTGNDNEYSHNRVVRAVRLITDAGALNVGGYAGFRLSENTIRGVYPSGWNLGAGFNQAFYLDIGSYKLEVVDNAVQGAQHGFALNCQMDNAIEGNALLSVQVPLSVSYGACALLAGSMSQTAWDQLAGVMTQTAGCAPDVSTGQDNCACNVALNCATNSTVQGDWQGSAAAAAAWGSSGPAAEYVDFWKVAVE